MEEVVKKEVDGESRRKRIAKEKRGVKKGKEVEKERVLVEKI